MIAKRAGFKTRQYAQVDPMLSKLLVLVALVLLALKYGLRAKLRELWRAIDGIINVLLVVIIVGYVVQIAIRLWTR
jgi:hypothetical protein